MRNHPRACGEHIIDNGAKLEAQGSSPRMRGNTKESTWTSCMTRDHPRACGEHYPPSRASSSSPGSSPRMRGTLLRAPSQPIAAGIIPAHAGNTADRQGNKVRCRDHPRACGEHTVVAVVFVALSGSSPRMRGTRACRMGYAPGDGIIPAHAGNTTIPDGDTAESGDHPRACGEHTPSKVPGVTTGGSSPRMRGTHCPSCCRWWSLGIIPAHAGNT